MYSILRPWLFRLEPERAHALTLRLMQVVGAAPPLAAIVRRQYAMAAQPVQAFGLGFANPIGLAAGYDKDGLAWRGLAALGFGHIEVGSVTLRPQAGNPRPRLFRLEEDRALINRMGFPSRGADFVARRLAGPRPPGLVLGVNLGLNKDAPLERAAEEYAELQRIFDPLADYLAVNVSSPNTAGLRALQAQERLAGLLAALKANKRKPLLVKLSPDLEERQLDEALEVLLDGGADGVIAVNTTLARPSLRSRHAGEAGGLSGAPLAAIRARALERMADKLAGRLPLVAAGGIMTDEDARACLEAGAALVQVYTGMVYGGPDFVRRLMVWQE
ncbi:MAG: quinone-dependent dihydroorotate dehydrogenase [Chloroflexi bacterium]|nr:quinone-dependent dihydroorotate dehydrogenase [Chloroflexota bacterium]